MRRISGPFTRSVKGRVINSTNEVVEADTRSMGKGGGSLSGGVKVFAARTSKQDLIMGGPKTKENSEKKKRKRARRRLIKGSPCRSTGEKLTFRVMENFVRGKEELTLSTSSKLIGKNFMDNRFRGRETDRDESDVRGLGVGRIEPAFRQKRRRGVGKAVTRQGVVRGPNEGVN